MPVPGLPYSDAQLWGVLNGVLPAWVLLGLAPRWRHTIPLVTATAALPLLASTEQHWVAGSMQVVPHATNGGEQETCTASDSGRKKVRLAAAFAQGLFKNLQH